MIGGTMANKRLILMIAGVMLAGVWAHAEPRAGGEFTAAEIQKNRKDILVRNMVLTKEQEGVFWPLYDEYQIERNKIAADRNAALTKFAINMNNLNDQAGQEVIDKLIDAQKKYASLRSAWLDRFGKSFSPKVIGRFYALEEKLDSIVDQDLTKQIHLVR